MRAISAIDAIRGAWRGGAQILLVLLGGGRGPRQCRGAPALLLVRPRAPVRLVAILQDVVRAAAGRGRCCRELLELDLVREALELFSSSGSASMRDALVVGSWSDDLGSVCDTSSAVTFTRSSLSSRYPQFSRMRWGKEVLSASIERGELVGGEHKGRVGRGGDRDTMMKATPRPRKARC